MSEWKPGDVALVNDCTNPEAAWKPATCTRARTPEREAEWLLHHDGVRVWSSVSAARPLVVIDPEDRERVAALIKTAWPHAVNQRPMTDALTEALHSLITPPKPEEPRNCGAVVEDASGDYWVYVARGADGAHWFRAGYPKEISNYRDIAAVTILSDGVQ